MAVMKDLYRTDTPTSNMGEDPVEWMSELENRGFHRDDRGERTNKRLSVQPYYQRTRSGKMKHY